MSSSDNPELMHENCATPMADITHYWVLQLQRNLQGMILDYNLKIAYFFGNMLVLPARYRKKFCHVTNEEFKKCTENQEVLLRIYRV